MPFSTDLNVFLPGHAPKLQDPVSVVDLLHSAPPYAAGVYTCLVRILVPPPHVAEHVDHSPKSPHSQLTASTYENNRANNNNVLLETYS